MYVFRKNKQNSFAIVVTAVEINSFSCDYLQWNYLEKVIPEEVSFGYENYQNWYKAACSASDEGELMVTLSDEAAGIHSKNF